MINMRGLICILLCFLYPTVGLSAEDDIQYQPSYQNIYQPCVADKDDFKFRTYTDVYRASIANTMQLFSFSSDAVSNNIGTRGISPMLDELLRNPTTSPALRKCFGSQDEEFAFIRNLLIADSVGKVVAISVSVVGARYLSLVLKKILGPLEEFSPQLFKAAMIAPVGGGAAYSSWNYYRDSKEDSDKQTPDQALALKNNIQQTMRTKATEEIQKIDSLLESPITDSSARKELQIKREQWQLILKSYS